MKRNYRQIGFGVRKRSKRFYAGKRNLFPPALPWGRRGGRRMARFRSRNYRTGGFLGIELKFLDTSWDGVTLTVSTTGAGGEMPPSSGCTGCVSVPAQGDGENERDGRNYTIKSVYCSGIISTTNGPDKPDVLDASGYFFALVLDTQTNGATISTEDLYVNPGTAGEQMLPYPLRNLENSHRFRILASTYVAPGGMYAGTDGASTVSISNMVAPTISLNWKGNIKCNTKATTANVTSATDNSIHLVAFSGNSLLTPVFQGKCRVRYVG